MSEAKKRTIIINAVLDSKSPNGHSFSMDDDKGGAANLVFNKDKDHPNMKKEDYYLIEFQLKNDKGVDLEFDKDRDKVLWACPESNALPNKCPPDNSHMDTVFYVHPTEKIQDKKLFVINTDMFDLEFVFAFNFRNNSGVGPNYVRYDPGGSNQNGGVPFIGPNANNAYVAIALGSAAIAAFATYWLMR